MCRGDSGVWYDVGAVRRGHGTMWTCSDVDVIRRGCGTTWTWYDLDMVPVATAGLMCSAECSVGILMTTGASW